MKRQLRDHIAALCLLAPVGLAFTALPATALAQPASPEVFSLQVTSDHGVTPGSRLHFTLRGTPNARAFVRIRGVRDGIPLREVDRGVYIGRYVVSPDDRIDPGDKINAILSQGNRTVRASYDIPPGLGDVASAADAQLRIDRFDVRALDRIEPGAELRFFVDGAPGATAFVELPGIERNVRLQEVRPGHYEGAYTIRRSDAIDPAAQPMARLRLGDRVVRANLNHPLMAAAPANVAIQILNHPNNDQVDGKRTHVRGRTAPFASVEIRVDAIPPVIGQFGVAQEVLSRTVQADGKGDFAFDFSSPFPVPGTRYDIHMVASKADVTNEAQLVLFQRRG